MYTKYCNIFSDYEICFSPIQVTCHTDQKISHHKGYNLSYEACKNLCNEDLNCKFIFSLNQVQHKHCVTYSSCDETRKPSNIGTTSSKDRNCPSKISTTALTSRTRVMFEIDAIKCINSYFNSSEIEVRTFSQGMCYKP